MSSTSAPPTVDSGSVPMLSLSGITRRFPAGERDVVVLHDVNLAIEAGEIVAIMGASGSGKSTLMNILGCLDHPSEGSYRVAGRETRDLDANALAQLRREHFGFIFQRYHLLPHLDAASNVEMPAVYTGAAHASRRVRSEMLLARLGLADRMHHRPSQLSGGQQQRVSIARALMNGGEVILADEPTGALDSRSGREVIRILKELNALGHTVIIVTHDENVAAHARRITEIRDGEIVADRANTPVVEPPEEMPGDDVEPAPDDPGAARRPDPAVPQAGHPGAPDPRPLRPPLPPHRHLPLARLPGHRRCRVDEGEHRQRLDRVLLLHPHRQGRPDEDHQPGRDDPEARDRFRSALRCRDRCSRRHIGRRVHRSHPGQVRRDERDRVHGGQ